MTKSLIVFSLMAAGMLGSWATPVAAQPEVVDGRPEALITGAALLILATVLRQVGGGGRAK